MCRLNSVRVILRYAILDLFCVCSTKKNCSPLNLYDGWRFIDAYNRALHATTTAKRQKEMAGRKKSNHERHIATELKDARMKLN